jgi:ribosomal protein S18 acetylase RimI-like enzyme
MNFKYRLGNRNDIEAIKKLAIKSWSQFEDSLTKDNWANLKGALTNDTTYIELFAKSTCFLCTCNDKVVGMAFLVPSGNPTDIYDAGWSYIRLASVDPDFGGRGIGRRLVRDCVQLAKESGEKTVALHTSELMTTARHIYESIGFAIIKELNERLGIRYWLYTLSLG